jgi:hypothetical protein
MDSDLTLRQCSLRSLEGPRDNPVYRSLYGSASRISLFATCPRSRLLGKVTAQRIGSMDTTAFFRSNLNDSRK